MSAEVVAVARSPRHTFSKPSVLAIRLVAGHGVEGDAHAGATVKHRSRVRRDPTRPNLRQVHLVEAELLDEVNADPRFSVRPGDIGENITTRGVQLLSLPTGAQLRIGGDAVVAVTGLRNPCRQLNDFQDGLMDAMLDRDAAGNLVRRAGAMGVVIAGGEVRPGDVIVIERPPGGGRPLEPV